MTNQPSGETVPPVEVPILPPGVLAPYHLPSESVEQALVGDAGRIRFLEKVPEVMSDPETGSYIRAISAAVRARSSKQPIKAVPVESVKDWADHQRRVVRAARQIIDLEGNGLV